MVQQEYVSIDSYWDALDKVPTDKPIYVDTCILTFGGPLMLGDGVKSLKVSMSKDNELETRLDEFFNLSEAVLSVRNFWFSPKVYAEFKAIQAYSRRKIRDMKRDVRMLQKKPGNDEKYRSILNLGKKVVRKHNAIGKLMRSKITEQPVDPLELRLVTRLAEIYRLKEKWRGKKRKQKDTDEDLVLQASTYARHSGNLIGILSADADVLRIFSLCRILFEDENSPWYSSNACGAKCHSFFARSGLRTSGYALPADMIVPGKEHISRSEVLERARREMDALVR